MKKILFFLPLLYLGLIMLLLLFFVSGDTGGGGGVPIMATEEEAYEYQYISAELGVPWDLSLLADAILAHQQGGKDMEGRTPLYTSLQFSIVTETEESVSWVESGQEDLETGEMIYVPVWNETGEKVYSGADEILKYLGMDKSLLKDMDITKLMDEIAQMAFSKETNETRYRSRITINADPGMVLREYIGLSEENCENVMQLHEADYMASLYGYVYHYGDIELPEVILGEVTRYELAQVAVSLLNHPYLLGGKSPQAGLPGGPLDCSGFVDWVYIQCFGAGVSSGRVPDGVAVSGTALQWYASAPVTKEEMRAGDLAFLHDPADLRAGKINHVGIYLGSYAGEDYFVHCAGKSYGTSERPSGRVGISRLRGGNSFDPIRGGNFEPSMKSCNFKYFRRPNFGFIGD